MTALLLLVSLAAPPAPVETPLDEKTLAALVADLCGKDLTKQYAARDALVKAGPKAKAAVPALAKLLESKEAGHHAVEVLGAIGPGAKDAVPTLLALLPPLGDSGYAVERVAVAVMLIDGPKIEATRALLMSSGKCTPIMLAVSQTLQERTNLVVPQVVALCSDKDAKVRANAAIILGELNVLSRVDKQTLLMRAGDGAKGVPAALEKLLADDNAGVRVRAAVAIASVAPQLASKCVPAIVAAVLSGDEKGMEGADNVTDAFRLVPVEAAKALVPLFDHKTDRIRWWAINTLASIRTGEQLAVALKDGKTARTREAAAFALGSREHGLNPAPALTAALKDSEFVVRFAAAGSLVRFAPHDSVAHTATVPVFVEGLQQTAEKVRLEAGQNLRMIGATAKDAIPALKKLLDDPKAEVQLEAAIALVAIDVKGAAGTVPVFVAALKSGDETAATRAATALPNLGAAAKDAVPELVKHFDAKSPYLRLRAAEAAARIDAAQGPKAAEALVTLLQDTKHKQDIIRAYSLTSLQRIGAPAKSAMPALMELLKDDGPFHGEVAFAMIVIDADNAKVAYDWMRKAMLTTDEDDEFVERLPELGERAKPLVPALADRLKAKSAYNRRSAAEVLGDIGAHAKESLPELKKLAESDPRMDVRKAAADAVKKIEK